MKNIVKRLIIVTPDMSQIFMMCKVMYIFKMKIKFLLFLLFILGNIEGVGNAQTLNDFNFFVSQASAKVYTKKDIEDLQKEATDIIASLDIKSKKVRPHIVDDFLKKIGRIRGEISLEYLFSCVHAIEDKKCMEIKEISSLFSTKIEQAILLNLSVKQRDEIDLLQKDYKSELDDLLNRIDDHKKLIASKDDKIIYFEKKYEEIKSQLSDLHNERDRLTGDLDRVALENAALNSKLSNIVSAITYFGLIIFILIAFVYSKPYFSKLNKSSIDPMDQYFKHQTSSISFKTTMTCAAYLEFVQSIEHQDKIQIKEKIIGLLKYITTLKGKNKLFRSTETLIKLDQDILNVTGVDLFIDYLLLMIPERLPLTQRATSAQEQAQERDIISAHATLTSRVVPRMSCLSSLATALEVPTTGRPDKDWLFDLAHVLWGISYRPICEPNQALEFYSLLPMSERPVDSTFRWFGDGRHVKRILTPQIRLMEKGREVHVTQGEGELV